MVDELKNISTLSESTMGRISKAHIPYIEILLLFFGAFLSSDTFGLFTFSKIFKKYGINFTHKYGYGY